MDCITVSSCQVRSGSRIVRRPLRRSSAVTAVDSLFPLVGGWLTVICLEVVDPPATWTTRAVLPVKVRETSRR